MSLFREIPPTAGLPLYFKDFFSRRPGSLEEDLQKYLGAAFTKVTYSGTAALYLILEALKVISPKKTVVIPAYICPLVPLAIKRAGMRIEVCDITGSDFNFNLQNLEAICSANRDILAIIPTHLAGIPLDYAPIGVICQKYNILSIEDCAQSLGAEYQGKKIGRLGDIAFYSLCRGKGLTIYEGGAIATDNPDYAVLIDKKTKELIRDDFFGEALKIFELCGYWLFYRPQLFWWAYGLPQVFWKLRGLPLKACIEEFGTDFAMYRVWRFRKNVGHNSFCRLEEEISRQQEKAALYIRQLEGLPGIKIVQGPSGSRATYPYLTLLFDHPQKRSLAWDAFQGKGLGVSGIYALAITDYPFLQGFLPEGNYPQAESLAKGQLTLSTSAYLTKNDLEKTVKLLRRSVC